MTGRGRGRGGNAGRGNNNNNGRGGRGRGGIRPKSTKTGVTKELEGNIFDLGERSSADLMRTTQIQIAQYVGSIYGGDIMGELQTKKEFVAPLPIYPETATARMPAYEAFHNAKQSNNLAKLRKKKTRLQAEIDAIPISNTAEIEPLEEKMYDIDNEILQLEYEAGLEIKVPLDEEEKGLWKQRERAYGERVSRHIVNQQKAFAVILGQCTTRLQEKMHDDPQWETVDKNQKPLELYSLIERVVLKQTGDEYQPCNLVENLLAVLTMKQQNNQSNALWYEKFSTRVDVAESVGVEFDKFTCLWNYCCEARSWGDYDTLTASEQSTIRSDSKERLLAYLLINNSSNTPAHETVKKNLLEAFIAKRDEYPTTRSDAIALLNKYDEKTKQPAAGASEGTAFAQKGKKGEAKDEDGDKPPKKNWFADKECFICGEKGHGVRKCPDRKKKDSDESSVSSSGSSKKNLEELEKKFKSAAKQFAQLKSQLEEDESDDDDDHSHFQFTHFSLTNHNISPEKTHTDMSMKQSKGKLDDLNLREVILLDNQSTMSLFCNKRMVTNIRNSDEPLTLRSNGGSMKVNKVASIGDGRPDVWFSTRAITNILSLKDAILCYRVTYDSYDEAFVVYREEHGLPNMLFKMHSSGLHFYDPKRAEFSFVVTVEENMKAFSKRQIVAAEKARSLYAGLGYPSLADYKWILKSNQIQECPVSVDDAVVAEKVWGPDISALKGKTTRKTPDPVPTDMVAVPKEIRELHRIVTISIDIFFVNKIPFFLTLSRKICFATVTHLVNRKTDTIYAAFKSIFMYYLQKGFQIMTVTGDNEFAPLAELLYELPGAPTLNLTSANEHEPYIERRIRVVKERTRAVRHSLPFASIPSKMLTHMVFFVVKLLNHFPVKGGVSTQYSPRTIMSGQNITYKQYSLPFGTYCQVHEEDGQRNSLAARTQGALSLGPSSNRQGGQLFYSLNTGRVISRRSWTVIPMPQSVITRVNELAADQPHLLTFTDRNGDEIGDADEGILPETPHEIPGVVVDDAVPIPGVDPEEGKPTTIETKDDQNIMPTTPLLEANEPTDEHQHFEPTRDDDYSPIEPPITSGPAVSETETAAATEEVVKTEEPTNNNPPTGPRRSTRARPQTKAYVPSMTGKSYQYAATQLAKTKNDPRVVEMVFTQLTLKAAIKTWGSRATVGAESEMKQLHWRNSFRPVRWSELTDQQKKTLLESHIFMKEKRDGTIKGRMVAGGNKQRGYIDKEESSSPTVATESVILTSIIDATEEREVAIIDVPNAFIQTVVEDEKKRVIIRIRGILVDMLVRIAPDVYEEYVTHDKNGNKVLLVECLNALYGTMVASLLYYQKFTKSLKEYGYKMNPYDPCVWNKQIDGKQCTICFHVDDCKISHVSGKVIDKTIERLRNDYESIFEDGSGKMQVHRGKVHKYLGMTLDFSSKKQVSISMSDYVKEIVEAWDKAEKLNSDGFIKVKRGKKSRATAAPEDLFKIDEDSTKLNSEMATAFHNIVAKALYLVKRARPDASVPIAFLTTRVRSPDIDDWRKLEHLMEYFRSTVDMRLILGANAGGVLNWYVDASFAVHSNMRGHTGGGLTMGRGFPIVSSTKQKLNTRSSTESELVGVDDMMPSILWTRYFLKAQGYKVSDNVIFQDNKSTMLLERNGKASSSKRTKHINVRYFFITDRISKGEVRVEWCPTKDMVADFMTKPLQGSVFRKFRDLIMGALSMEEAASILTRDPVKETDRESLAHK